MAQIPQPQPPQDNRNRIERMFNLPPLKAFGEIKEDINSVNTLLQSLDKEKLKMITNLLNMILKVQQGGGKNDLQLFCQIIQIISTIPPDKLDKVVSIVSDIRCTVEAVQKIIKSLPPDMMQGLKLGDIAGEIKKEIGK